MRVGIAPEPPDAAEIGALPPHLREAFEEAEGSFSDGRRRAASTGYRAVIDIALKILDPEGTGSLYHRIEAMQGALPQSLIDLLHEVRFLGNDGAHQDAPGIEDIAKGRDFTRLFLTYMFELPDQVRTALADRQGERAT